MLAATGAFIYANSTYIGAAIAGGIGYGFGVAIGREQTNEDLESEVKAVKANSKRREEEMQSRIVDAQLEVAKYKALYGAIGITQDMLNLKDLSGEELAKLATDSIEQFKSKMLANPQDYLVGFMIDKVTGQFIDDPVLLPTGYCLNRETLRRISNHPGATTCPYTGKSMYRHQLSFELHPTLMKYYELLKTIGIYDTVKSEVMKKMQEKGIQMNAGSDWRPGVFSEPASQNSSYISPNFSMGKK